MFYFVLFFTCFISSPIFAQISVSLEVQEAPKGVVRSYYGKEVPAKEVHVRLEGPIERTKPITAKVYNLLGLQTTMETIVVDDGLLLCSEGPASFILGNLSLGEPVQFVFEQGDKEIANMLYCAYPFMATDNKGHCVELFFINPDATLFAVNILNYKDGEKLKCISRSCSEKLEREVTFQEQNLIRIDPTVLGRKSGPASVTIVSKDSNLTVKYTWGKRIPAPR